MHENLKGKCRRIPTFPFRVQHRKKQALAAAFKKLFAKSCKDPADSACGVGGLSTMYESRASPDSGSNPQPLAQRTLQALSLDEACVPRQA